MTVRVLYAGMGSVLFDPFEGQIDSINSAAFSSDHRQAISDTVSNSLSMCGMQIRSSRMHRPVIRKLAQPRDLDGWIRQSDHAVILWVPLEYRHGLIDRQ